MSSDPEKPRPPKPTEPATVIPPTEKPAPKK